MPYDPRFEQKTTEAAAYLITLSGGRMRYIKLLKLLYYADREAFAEWERPITYDNYVSMDYGPVLSSTYNMIKGETIGKYWNRYITTNGYFVSLKGETPAFKKLSPAEIDLIKKIFDKYNLIDPFELSTQSHNLPEYKKPPKGSSVPISLKELLEALSFPPQEIDRITSEVKEEASIAAFFGA